jgi:hypothetical protein
MFYPHLLIIAKKKVADKRVQTENDKSNTNTTMFGW